MNKSGLRHRIAVTILLTTVFTHAFSQEKLGIANSNYSSTNSIFLNPSSSVDSRTFIQLNLIGLNAYAYTNQAYLPKFSVWRKAEQPVIITNKTKKFFYGNFSLDAPALIVSNRRIGFGFFVRGCAEIDIRNLPYELTNILLQQKIDTVVPKYAELNLRNVKISEMAWAEYGVNFGMMTKKRNGLLITAGGNLKYLTGINLFYANLGRLNGYIKDSLIDIKQLKGKIRIAQPGWRVGKGYGLDLGIIYRKALKSDVEYEGYYVNSPKSNCEHIDYLFKAGLSLLDLGYIKFNQQTYKGSIDGNIYVPNYHKVTNTDSLLRANFDTVSRKNEPITATLPTALSAQLDMNMSHHIYLNVTAIKSVIPARLTGVQRANLLSIAPRYERRIFEVAMPLTFHRFIYPQLGLAFRIRTFVLGFDNIFPFIFAKNTYGLNVYFNLGISLFRNPDCREKHHKVKKEKKKQWSNYDCPKFGKRNILGY